MRTVRLIASGLAALAAVATLMSCSVVGSAPVTEYAMVSDPRSPALDAVRCATRLGSYSLPKSMLHVTVMKGTGSPVVNTIRVDGDKRVPDNKQTYCLDYLSNSFADDTVRVAKDRTDVNNNTVTTPYLQLVASNAKDQSATIIRKLIRTAFILISGSPNFAGARSALGAGASDKSEVVRDLTFDPFDQVETAEINRSITPLGFCVVLGDYSYDVDAMAIDGYCAAPQQAVKRHPSPRAEAASRQRFLIPRPRDGIFYRPRADYPVSVYVKADPGGTERWRLAQMQYFGFENISPVISVGVGRAVFAQQRTGLVFDNGALTNVCLTKGSEVAGFVNIPLDVVYGVIALPTQTIQASINSAATRKNLLDAQSQLLQAQQAYIAYLKDPSPTTLAGVKGDTSAGPLKLGSDIPAPPDTTALLTDYKLSGDSAAIGDDDVLKDICSELALKGAGVDILASGSNKGMRF